jgi:predicted GNAT superfamily acetyltransferase
VTRERPSFEIRSLLTHAELAACVALQRETWGRRFTDIVPPTILRITQRLGGVSAGAFDPSGAMLGFVFGVTGVEQGRIVHWSDMLAVRPEARDLGIGRALKEHQREVVRALGAETMYWTYDPLQARNANLNLNVLGVRVVEYIEDMYGKTDSDLHRGLGTDRFVVAWDLAAFGSGVVPERARATGWGQTPLLNPEGSGAPTSVERALDGHGSVRVQIPADIGTVQARSLDEAAGWRASTRAAIAHALASGFEISGFIRDDAASRGYYLMQRITPA